MADTECSWEQSPPHHCSENAEQYPNLHPGTDSLQKSEVAHKVKSYNPGRKDVLLDPASLLSV